MLIRLSLLLNFVFTQSLLASPLIEYLKNNPDPAVKTDAFILFAKGKVHYRDFSLGHDQHTRHRGWSMAKSLLAFAYGIAENKNLINRQIKLNECIKDAPVFYSEISIENLLQMTSGIDWNEHYEASPFDSDIVNLLFLEQGYQNMTSYVLNKKQLTAAGERFNYSSGDSILLAKCLENKLKIPLYDFLKTHLFNPYQMSSVKFEYDQQGLWVGSSYFYATLDDFFKFGLTLLKAYKNQLPDLIHSDFIHWAVSPNVKKPHPLMHKPSLPYGAGFWLAKAHPNSGIKSLAPHETPVIFAAMGHNGQSIVVIPDYDIVAVRLANDQKKGIDFSQYIRLLIAEFQH
jgi:CubicO group peptidase (beta-lactamase class C family)